MNDDGKSDKPIVPAKGANNGRGQPRSAERLEGRGLAKGNSLTPRRTWTQCQIGTATGAAADTYSLCASVPKAGARCGSAARRDLCGGRGVTRVPTATLKDQRDSLTRRMGSLVLFVLFVLFS